MQDVGCLHQIEATGHVSTQEARICIRSTVGDLLRTAPRYGRGVTAVAMGKRPVWQIQTCQYCGKQGHNARSCPSLALKLLKKLQVKHSVTAMSKAVMDGCEPLTVQGIERRRGSRKAAQRLEHRRVRVVHKGTRGVASARKKRVPSNRKDVGRKRGGPRSVRQNLMPK